MNLAHKIIYSCQEATLLVVKKAEIELSLMQRIRLWMHLQMCAACKRFNLQNEWIDKQLHKNQHQLEKDRLTEAQKTRIATNLEAEK